MASTVALAQFLRISARPSLDVVPLFLQNFFVGQDQFLIDNTYRFVPFEVRGALQSAKGDNGQMSILLPNVDMTLQMLQALDGARLARLEVRTVWLNDALEPDLTKLRTDFFIGIGSSISDTTIELRCRSAIDSVTDQFPRRTLNVGLVGPLPQSAEVVLR